MTDDRLLSPLGAMIAAAVLSVLLFWLPVYLVLT